MFGSAINSRPSRSVGLELEPELGRDHDLIANRSQTFTDQFFICKWAIHFGGIEEGDSAFHRCAQQSDHLLLVLGWAIRKAHSHTAKSNRRNFQVTAPKYSPLHLSNSSD